VGSGLDDRRRVRWIAYRSRDRRNETIPTHSLSRMPDITAHDYSPPRRADIGSRKMGQPTIQRAARNAEKRLALLSIAGYSSTSNLGNNSVGDSPSSACRVRDSSLTRPLFTRSLFTLPNGLRRSRHNVRSASLRHAEDIESLSCTRVRYSTAEDTALSALKICAADDTCQSRCLQQTSMGNATIPGPRGKTLA